MSDFRPDDSARNLLFGLLAFQNNFIDRRSLLVAFDVWTSQKTRPLGRILVEQGGLSDGLLDLIDGLVTAHLAKHDNEPEKSLASLAPVGTLRHDLETIADFEVRSVLSQISVDRTSDDDPFATRAPSVAPPTSAYPFETNAPARGTTSSSGVRFRIVRPLNKGGMGVVSVALDTELDRSIALKEIREAAADNLEYRARFLAEAEITAKLEHPGIIPIYGLGTYADGRPYYAMRLIRGDNTGSLMDAIKRFHAEPDSPRRGVEFRGLLRRFLDVCNALSYAHSKGVLHRDLKPDNILLGQYGETLVVDWGLAKAVGRADPVVTVESGEVQLHLSGNESSPTLDGSAIGTPEYGPPEQMTGDLPNIGPRSDVYGLGAVLYCLMTGRAPFSRKEIGLNALIGKIDAGDFPAPRQVRPEIDKSLEAVCLKAMARKPSERYESVEALAHDVEKYLADEPVSACRDPWTRRARRWARKHRTAVTCAAAMLLVGFAALAVGLVVVGGLNRRLDQSNANLSASLTSETKALRLAVERKRLADENFTLALDTVTAQVFDIDEQLKNHPGTRDLREKLQKSASDRLKTLIDRTSQKAVVDRTAMVAHNNLGDIYLRVDLKPTLAREEYQKGYEIAKHLSESDPADTQAKRDLSISYERLGNVSVQTGETAKALEFHTKALEIREEQAKADPKNASVMRDLMVANNKLGDVLFQTGDTAKALEFYRKGLGVSEAMAKAYPDDSTTQRDLAISCDRLGDVLFQTGETAEAIAYFERGLGVTESLAKADPGNSQAQADLSISHGKLGDVLLRTGATAKALESYRKGMAVDEAQLKLDPDNAQFRRDLSVFYSKQGDVLLQTGDTAKALDSFQKGLELRQSLAKADPKDSQAQRDLSIIYERLGNGSLQTGDTAKALDFYQKNLLVTDALAKADPDDSQAKRDLSVSYNKLGDASLMAGATAKALEYYRKDLEVSEALAKSAPKDLQAQRDLSICHDRLGNVSLRIGEAAKAIESYRKALALREAVAKADPRNLQAQRDLLISNIKLGDVSFRENDAAKADEYYRTCIAVCEVLEKADPKNPRTRIDLATVRGRLGDVLLRKGEISKAIASYTIALEISKKLAEATPANADAQRDQQLNSHNLRLAEFLNGTPIPKGDAETLLLGRWALEKKVPAASVRIYAQALGTDPAPGDASQWPHRYFASQAAAQAGTGQGFDVPKPDDALKAKLRGQALKWLRADLALAEKIATTEPKNKLGIVKILEGWKKDSDLAGIREVSALEKLPEAERKDWQALWADVESLRAKIASN